MNGNPAKNIKRYRKKAGLTQLKLAEALYVLPQTVSKWESGISEPDIEKLCAMADIFGISLDALVRGQNENAKKALIAIDGGGTKTDFLLFTEDGEVIERIILGGSNPNAHGMENTKSILSEGIERLCRSGYEINGIFAGISGASVGENHSELNDYLKKRYPYTQSCVEGDIHNVINSVQGADEKCIAAICGTGSVVYGYDGEKLHRRGGWGYLFDEAGSGFDIGRDALRHALACEEGECMQSELSRVICKAIGGGIFNNIGTIYAKGKDYIASFAPLVLELASKGESVSLSIVKKSTERLAYLINATRESFDCGNIVVVAGGLTSRRDVIEKMLCDALSGDLKIVFADKAPIVGAAVKCARLYSTNREFDLLREKIEREVAAK